MARNKNSTALFDVIHAAKKPPKASPSANMPTPRWWGKDRKLDKKVPQPAPIASTENVGKQKSWLTAARKSGVGPATVPAAPVCESESTEPFNDTYRSTESTLESTPAAPAGDSVDDSAGALPHVSATDTVHQASVADVTSAKSANEANPKTRFIDRFIHRSQTLPEVSAVPADSVIESPVSDPVRENPTEWTDSDFVQTTAPATSMIRSSAKAIAQSSPQSTPDHEPAFKVDTGRKEFLFRLSYGGIIAIGFIVVLALGIAFIAGKRTANDTADSDSLPNPHGPSTGTGMLVAVAKPDSEIVSSPNVMNVDRNHSKPAIVIANPSAPAGPTPPPQPLKRTRDVGVNYVVIQSYAEQDLAQKACDFVNRSGVPCTVVQGPAEWAPHDWYSVIGLQPIAKGGQGLEEYKRNVRAIGLKFSNKAINQFDPHGYTWRADSDLSQQ
jgi:hypothetical protein